MMDTAKNPVLLILLGLLVIVTAGCVMDGDDPAAAPVSDQEANVSADPIANDSTVLAWRGEAIAWTNIPCSGASTEPGWCSLDTPGRNGDWNFTWHLFESVAEQDRRVTIDLSWTMGPSTSENLNLSLHERRDGLDLIAADVGPPPLAINASVSPADTYQVYVQLPDGVDTKTDVSWTLQVQGPVEKVPRG